MPVGERLQREAECLLPPLWVVTTNEGIVLTGMWLDRTCLGNVSPEPRQQESSTRHIGMFKGKLP